MNTVPLFEIGDDYPNFRREVRALAGVWRYRTNDRFGYDPIEDPG